MRVCNGRALAADTLKRTVINECLNRFSRSHTADFIILREPFFRREFVPWVEHTVCDLALDRLSDLPIKRNGIFVINWTAHTFLHAAMPQYIKKL